MSGSVNKAVLIGNIASDPKLKVSPKGVSSLTFSFATNARWKDDSGETKTKASFHYIRIRGKRADILEQYLKKGKQLFIEGEINYEEWGEGKDKKPVTVINANIVEMLGTGGGDSSGSTPRRETRTDASRRERTPDPAPDNGSEFEDGIPF